MVFLCNRSMKMELNVFTWFWLVVAILLQGSYAQTIYYTPPNSYLIKCGGVGNITIDTRVWQGDQDVASSFLSSSSSVTASVSDRNIPLLNTSRIFTGKSCYTFTVSPGRIWIRLFFYPFNFQTYNPVDSATFSVTANQFTLLYNFKPTDSSVTSSPRSNVSNISYVFKEYSINVTASSLQICFIPKDQSSYAFINAIEIVSTPSKLITDDTSYLTYNAGTSLGITSMALETMYRINVGGELITPVNDTLELYRTWYPHKSYLLNDAGVEENSTSVSSILDMSSNAIFAPPAVYSTALQINNPQSSGSTGLNLSWVFDVDPGYTYIVRFHLCELVWGTGGKRVFNLYLQNQTAYSNLDLALNEKQYNPYHADFTLAVEGRTTNLWVQAGSNTGTTEFNDPIVNGLEIWKVNNSDASLSGTGIGGYSSKSGSQFAWAKITGGVAGALILVAVVTIIICCCCRQRAKVVKQPTSAWVPLTMHGGHSASVVSKTTVVSGAGSYASSVPSSMGRVFSFVEILEATHNFDESLVIGVGGFGKVYQGDLDDGTKVAVKRGNPRSEQGIMEFQTEIEMLSKLRHRHLVSLIGYCKENNEMILVYELMANGPLRSHLYGSNLPPLSWRQRLEICVGAARGLHYLHTGATQSIIHRDVKTTNILLDENLVAKVSDFGLSKTGPALDQTHVSTAVKGSFGYLDPEYFRRQQLTEKSDVYSFGVVLMEVLCARPAINPSLPRDQVNIAEWAMHWQSKGLLHQIIDPHLVGSISMDSLAKFGETAEKCLAEEGISRPAMGQVLWSLEYALQLQDRATARDANEDTGESIMELPMLPPVEETWEEGTELNHSRSRSFVEGDEEGEDVSMSTVFSRMVRPTAM